MEMSLLGRVLSAQSVNSTLAGEDLRAAASGLIAMRVASSCVVLTYDAAGQRIVGAALMLSDAFPAPFDSTRSTADDAASCLLVGGVIAGSAGVTEAACLARQLGASRVTAAILGGWSEPISGVDEVYPLPMSDHVRTSLPSSDNHSGACLLGGHGQYRCLDTYRRSHTVDR